MGLSTKDLVNENGGGGMAKTIAPGNHTLKINSVVLEDFQFIDGAKQGKSKLLKNFGLQLRTILSEFIDANARVGYDTLHHVYEWGQSGSSSARLFDIKFTISNLGLSFMSDFKQSKTKSKILTKIFINSQFKLKLLKLAQLTQSQLLQELFVINFLNFKKKGFFVEFGACDGIFFSNTLLLEKFFFWKGILGNFL